MAKAKKPRKNSGKPVKLDNPTAKERVAKKLREAAFFANKLGEWSPHSDSDREHFDFYLSAFLNASESVVNRLNFYFAKAFKGWHANWNSRSGDDGKLIKFFSNDRSEEVHRLGSSRGLREVEIPLDGNIHVRGLGRSYVSSPPDVTFPPATLYRQDFFFTIAGEEEPATDACRNYLEALQRMAQAFFNDTFSNALGGLNGN